MDDAGGVGFGEALRELVDDIEEPAQREASPVQERPKGRALNPLHRDVRGRPVAPDLVDRQNVGVIERGGGARLELESPEAVRVRGDLGPQHLDRDDAVEARIAGFVNLAHPAGADRGQNLVGTEAGWGKMWHGAPLLYGPEQAGPPGGILPDFGRAAVVKDAKKEQNDASVKRFRPRSGSGRRRRDRGDDVSSQTPGSRARGARAERWMGIGRHRHDRRIGGG